MRWVEHITGMGKMENACTPFVRKLEAKRPVWTSLCRWDYEIKMDLGEIEWKVVNWILLVDPRDHGNKPLDSTRGKAFLDELSGY
jgi:hypothetical protein